MADEKGKRKFTMAFPHDFSHPNKKPDDRVFEEGEFSKAELQEFKARGVTITGIKEEK